MYSVCLTSTHRCIPELRQCLTELYMYVLTSCISLSTLPGYRHLAAIRMLHSFWLSLTLFTGLAIQRGITQLSGPEDRQYQYQEKMVAFLLVLEGFRTNPCDPKGHIFFDVEALILKPISEVYSRYIHYTNLAKELKSILNYKSPLI